MADEKFVFGTDAEKANRRGHLGADSRSFIRPVGGRDESPQSTLSGMQVPARKPNGEGRGV